MLNLVHYSLAQQRINFPLLLWVYCNVPINIKKKKCMVRFLWFSRVPPNPTTHHSLFIHLFIPLAGSLPYFSFLSFSSFSFAVEHISSLLQTILPAPPYHHFHRHFSDKITKKLLWTHKHLYIFFLRKKISHLFGGFFTFTWGYFYLSFNNDIHVIYEHWKWYLCVFMYGFCIGEIIW